MKQHKAEKEADRRRTQHKQQNNPIRTGGNAGTEWGCCMQTNVYCPVYLRSIALKLLWSWVGQLETESRESRAAWSARTTSIWP